MAVESIECSALLFALLLFLIASDPLADAVDALQRNDLATAERILRTELKARPGNSEALGLLGVVLDQEKKFGEAESLYKRAVSLTPHSTPLLNNFGNHLLAAGKLNEAREVFLKVVNLDAAHANANMQLARLAVHRKLPEEALRYLDHLPASVQQSGQAEIVRMQALYGLNRTEQADALLDRLAEPAQGDARLSYSLALALAAAGQYGKAEELFSRALAMDPDNFDILYNLGLAASHAGHNERAREILESALRQRPQNVDVLYDLAAVNASLGQREKAVQLLAEAGRVAPDRAEVQQLLARTAADLGYFADAIQAWDRYLKLVPGDDVARRERAFAITAIGDDMDSGLAGLRKYTAKYPKDAVGFYELGVAAAVTAPSEAMSALDRALVLKPDLTPAHIARGLLRLKQGDFAGALPDFEFAARREPNNPVVLDRLGQTQMALQRPAEAVPNLRKAAELAPRDSKILMHLGRALTSAGRADEATAVFARFRELGPDRSGTPHPPGLVDFLSLSPQEQMARYRAGVERTVRSKPDNVEAQVRYLKLLLEDGKTDEAAEVVRHLIALKPSDSLLADASEALLGAEQYGAAKELLENATQGRATGQLALDLAIAASHAVNPQAGLEQLDRVAEDNRTADYYLIRAEILDTLARPDEAARMMDIALQSNPSRPDLYRWAAIFLIRTGKLETALELLNRGASALPDNPDIPLMRAITLAALSNMAEAERVVSRVETRWPDWHRVWIVHAILLEWQGQSERAKLMIESAEALGGKDASDVIAQAAKILATYPASPDRAVRLMQSVFT